MNPYFERYLRNRYAAVGEGGPRWPGWPGGPGRPGMPPRPMPPPTPGGTQGPGDGRPLYIYECRHYSADEARHYCYFTVAPGSQFAVMPPECNTIVGGPFRTMREADAYIWRSYGVRRGETFSC